MRVTASAIRIFGVLAALMLTLPLAVLIRRSINFRKLHAVAIAKTLWSSTWRSRGLRRRLAEEKGLLVGVSRRRVVGDRKGTRLNSSHLGISYAVFCLKKKKITE